MIFDMSDGFFLSMQTSRRVKNLFIKSLVQSQRGILGIHLGEVFVDSFAAAPKFVFVGDLFVFEQRSQRGATSLQRREAVVSRLAFTRGRGTVR